MAKLTQKKIAALGGTARWAKVKSKKKRSELMRKVALARYQPNV